MKIAALLALALLTACSPAPPPAAADTRAADAQAIKAVEEAAFKGWAARDASQIASMYSPAADIFFANLPPLKGADMAATVKGMLTDPNLSAQFVNAKVEVAGDLGYTQGTYDIVTSDPQSKKPMREKGRYVTVFAKQDDGTWKVVSDISTPAGPATPVTAATGK